MSENEMVEKVARAIDPDLFANFPKINLYRSNYEKVYAQARAAIEAMREPTDKMLESFTHQYQSADALDSWRIMVDAALEGQKDHTS